MTQYYQIIELKTARLFELVSFGLLLLDKTVFPEKISTIARDFGILFQLLDDYFDYFRESKSHQSKALGKDFDEKKMTLPVILALEHDLLRAENFWETESCFDSFLKKITPIESQCRCVINQHYQSLLERTSGMPHTQSIILEAIHAFAPQAIELLSAEY
jgi:geranylgeranyl pyrophosphate synthase